MKLLPSFLSLLVVACAPAMMPVEEGPSRWVGTVENADALIAFALEEGQVVGYVCGKSTWETHTGWFATTLVEGSAAEDGDLVPASSASGHALENVHLSHAQVVGQVRFADGTVAPFTAVRADPRTAAGLYDSTNAEGQAGLIVTNDLDAAGAATSLGADLAPLRAPITVNGPLGSAPPNAPITVTIPNLTVTTVTPVVPAQQSVGQPSPLLVILVHGMSHPIDADLSKLDTPEYSRGEWSVDFLRGLLGAPPNAALPLFTFRGPFNDANYATVATTFDANLAESAIAGERNLPTNFVALQPLTLTGLLGQPPRPPPVAAFVTYRDSTGGLVQSGQRVGNQAYLALRWYELTFRRTPRVVFVAQSFGGVTARFVLSVPTNAQLAAANVSNDGFALTVEDARRMTYVRDRTVSLVTMGTPHEGSFLADNLVPVQQFVQDVATGLEGAVNPTLPGVQFGASLRVLAEVFPELRETTLTTEQVRAVLRRGLADLKKHVDGRALRDLTHPFWERVNRGPLHPRRARRATSPIIGASGQLIPVYAGGARSPGGRAFTAPELSAFKRFEDESERERTWITNTMIVDVVLRLGQLRGYGSSTAGAYLPFDQRLDRRRRIADFGAFVRGKATDVASRLSPWVVENSTTRDALDTAVTLAVGRAGGLSVPIYLEHEGSFDLGARVQAPALGFECTDGGRQHRIVLDFGRLLTALVQTYSSLSNARQRVGDLDLNGLLTALGVAAQNVDDIKDWFVQKYVALAVADGRCALPDANPANLLNLGNLVNWHLVSATDEFPAPRWVESNTPASDDEIDSDGPVAFDSAVGLTLGTTTPLFFEHTRTDDLRNGQPVVSSWYRFFDSPIEPDCHGMQHQFVAGEWVFDDLLGAGPAPRASGMPVW